MCKCLVREVLLEELHRETVRYTTVVRAGGKVLGRPASSKFFRNLEKRHTGLTETQVIQLAPVESLLNYLETKRLCTHEAMYYASMNVLWWDLEL